MSKKVINTDISPCPFCGEDTFLIENCMDILCTSCGAEWSDEYRNTRAKTSTNSVSNPVRAATTLGQRIRIAARNIGGGNELSRKLSVTRKTIGSWFSDETEPKVSQIVLISELSNIPLEWLATGNGDLNHKLHCGKPNHA